MRHLPTVFVLVALAGCTPTYSLVTPGATEVGDGRMAVTASIAWNSLPVHARQPDWEEAWTLNGPLLESVVFVTGVPDGQSLVKHRRRDDARVAVFRADMAADDLVTMFESWYRARGVTVFAVDSVDPLPFLGGTGLQLRYRFAPGDGIGRKGTAVMRVVDERLYLMKLEGVTSHYFDAARPEFERMVASAQLAR
jgi:hypothetical protein